MKKYIFYILSIIIILIIFSLWGEKSQNNNYFFMKLLLNQSPEYVEKILGHPDTVIKLTDDCFDLKIPLCATTTYQNKKFEVDYYDGLLKTIVINGLDDQAYNSSFIEKIDFSGKPLINNFYNIRWDTTTLLEAGIKEIVIFPKKDDAYFIRYAMIFVDKEYNKPFLLMEKK
ncbi:MAG: hypothetical protein QM526_01555 [Alphaproteobacteria bacterium]|nr:hypothetical protein [Alphaproteobacteria bacterium]